MLASGKVFYICLLYKPALLRRVLYGQKRGYPLSCPSENVMMADTPTKEAWINKRKTLKFYLIFVLFGLSL